MREDFHEIIFSIVKIPLPMHVYVQNGNMISFIREFILDIIPTFGAIQAFDAASP